MFIISSRQMKFLHVRNVNEWPDHCQFQNEETENLANFVSDK